MLQLQNVSYRYPLEASAALSGVDLAVEPGERLLVCGRSGCGKSTLLRLASGLVAGHGRGLLTGQVRLDGRDPADLTPTERSGLVGYVGQDPRDQIVAGSVADEVAFGPEGQGLDGQGIADRVRSSLQRVGLDVPWTRDPVQLSGGQQQRLAVAAALAGGGGLLLLDEPLARLDEDGALRLLGVLDQLALDGVAVILAEHRLERCLPWADRVVVLERGAVVFDGDRDNGQRVLGERELLRTPTALELPTPGPVLVSLSGVTVRYEPLVAVSEVDIEVRRGERIALVGPNGAGKSTLIGALAGRLWPATDGVRILEVPQDPDLALFSDTVREELAYGPTERGLSSALVAQRVAQVAEPLGLTALLDRPPQALSSGERLRVAVGSALTCQPDLLLLDEPTAGQDVMAVAGLLAAIAAAAPDAAVVFATHDAELARGASHRVLPVEAPPQPVEAIETPPSGLGRMDPRARLALLGAVGMMAVVLDRPASLALLAACSGAALFTLPIGWAWRRRALLIAATLMWSTALSQGLFYGEVPRSALLQLGPLTLWREGLWHGMAQSLRLLAAAFAGVALAVSTPTDRLVAGLAALRVPWAVGLLAAVALRAVPSVGSEWAVVRAARSARGRPMLARGPWAWLVLEARLLRPVAARALRRARALALSLDARGFDPNGRRSQRVPLEFSRWDVGLVVPVWTGVIAAVGLELLYRAYLAEVLYLPALRPVYGLVRTWL